MRIRRLGQGSRLGALALAAGLFAGGAAAQEPIRIGVTQPLTGAP